MDVRFNEKALFLVWRDLIGVEIWKKKKNFLDEKMMTLLLSGID
jgi:hypothetical protein